MEKKTGQILCLAFSKGAIHDLHLYKNSHVHAQEHTILVADKGYVGLKKLHTHSLIPQKRSKNHPLLKTDKKYNQAISSVRIPVEHTIRLVKRFRILSECYRNRRRRFALRFSLIAGICNFDALI